MTSTDIRGKGRETSDAVLAVVLGGLAATADGWLLSLFLEGARASNARRDAVNATLLLTVLILFAALLGSLAAGRRSTPHRRWRCAMLGAVLGNLALPALLVVAMVVHPPTASIPW
ncbi:hypothetical protein ACFV0O_21715 [Kitasatospora sp. NPDC059577]|uniref:hypothetical protein n=1 Tax=unclassified Kitasatospora TaxID=2633591 RepID=UPI0036A6D6E3